MAINDPEVVFSDVAFEGLRTPGEVSDTMRGWLHSMLEDIRIHMQIAPDLDADPRKSAPNAWQTAVNRVAKKQGWWPESYSLLLESNGGFLENHGTSISHVEDVEHRVSPCIALALGMEASKRKSGLLEHADQLLLNNPKAPESGFGERKIMFTEATKRGIASRVQFHLYLYSL